ncbi:hypothetical protein BV898_19720 [Hypsibius exemplaris]|uniref:Uncharacterized protein n=1 Tax=Hypsibius exemplaris TaxID=2072580 RepID=A0A9X6NM41_HYPEX|nr:hypothetical protein BV898_19720 [Hypsibius exemplaris]
MGSTHDADVTTASATSSTSPSRPLEQLNKWRSAITPDTAPTLRPCCTCASAEPCGNPSRLHLEETPASNRRPPRCPRAATAQTKALQPRTLGSHSHLAPPEVDPTSGRHQHHPPPRKSVCGPVRVAARHDTAFAKRRMTSLRRSPASCRGASSRPKTTEKTPTATTHPKQTPIK